MIAHCNLEQNMCLCSKQSSLFSFYALSSGGKSKHAVVHSRLGSHCLPPPHPMGSERLNIVLYFCLWFYRPYLEVAVFAISSLCGFRPTPLPRLPTKARN